MINEKAATVLGTLGTVCWCIQLLPQVYYNWKKKNCEGVPPVMLFLWAFCGVPFAIYFISTRANVAVQMQPEIFFVTCTVTWIQTLYYPPVKLPLKRILMIVTPFIVLALGAQIGFILGLRPLYDRGIKWPSLIFGIIASVALAVGLLPPYFELYKRNGRVVGLNMMFIAIDCSGALLSMLSVVVGNMDIMGIIIYCICAALEIGIMLSHFIWCCRFKWFGNHVEDEESQSDKDENENDNDNQNENDELLEEKEEENEHESDMPKHEKVQDHHERATEVC